MEQIMGHAGFALAGKKARGEGGGGEHLLQYSFTIYISSNVSLTLSFFTLLTPEKVKGQRVRNYYFYLYCYIYYCTMYSNC